ncbi:hypothetical protein OOZ63_09400 [Paucibacter sp. PLA-PC-4]|uniref:hypothetical protein n=1 Tax=Paucibacter sp. PLA-PC-4 TaxID=2993655 RepID=UPI002248E991|nr:hypothetical protein [Paucibacter sp. PLA-PC-4]MCX2862055.1 hypothetical protein [Paucibacter sp. PLA-PC-4]
MSTILPLRPRTTPMPATQSPSTTGPARPLLDRWFLAWAEKAEARWARLPLSRYY